MAGTDNVDEIKIILASEVVEVGVYKCKTGASTPMSEKAGFDIIKSQIPFHVGIAGKENHSYLD